MIPARRHRFSPCWHHGVLQGLWNVEVVDLLCGPRNLSVDSLWVSAPRRARLVLY